MTGAGGADAGSRNVPVRGGCYSEIDRPSQNRDGMHAGSLGGAVAQDSSQATLGGCLFAQNRAQSQGGALYQSNTTGDVTTCTFSNNTAANGGAVYQNLAHGEAPLLADTPSSADQRFNAHPHASLDNIPYNPHA